MERPGVVWTAGEHLGVAWPAVEDRHGMGRQYEAGLFAAAGIIFEVEGMEPGLNPAEGSSGLLAVGRASGVSGTPSSCPSSEDDPCLLHLRRTSKSQWERTSRSQFTNSIDSF